MSNLDDAIAIAQAADVPAPAPEPATEAAPEAPPAPEPAPEAAPEAEIAVPDPAPAALPPDVRDRLRQRREQKGESRELAELRRTVAELQARLERPAPGSGIDPAALRANPIKALEAVGVDPTTLLNTLSRHAIQPGTAELDARHAQTESELRALKERIDRQNEEEAMVSQQRSAMRAREEFAKMTGDAARHPLMAKLSAARRMDRGTKAANELLSEGIDDFTMDDVAELAEQGLRAEMTELLGRDPLAVEAPPKAEPPKVVKQPDARAKTITASAAATAATPARPMTDRERLEAAIQIAKR